MRKKHILATAATISVMFCFGLLAWKFDVVPRVRRALPFSAPLPDPKSTGKAGSATFSDPVRFVRERVTGGVGVLTALDGDFPLVLDLRKGSPGEAAGLRAGDHIIAIDGASTKGWPMDEVKNALGGLVGTIVTLEIRKGDSTTVTVAVPRMNWRELLSLP